VSHKRRLAGVYLYEERRLSNLEVDKFAECEHKIIGMHVISRKALKEAGEIHADAVDPLDAWYRIAIKATWKMLVELQGRSLQRKHVILPP